jgi:predicted Zn-dependent protease
MQKKRFVTALVSALLMLTQPPAVLAQGYNLPSLGAAAGSTISPHEERQMGEQIMVEVRSDPTYLNDPETSEYINKIGYRLAAASPSKGYDFEFFVVKDPSLNAFALPGGFIAVHSGLIIATSNESELASVLAHEVSHVSQRHIARMLESQKGNWAMTIGSLLLAILAARAGSGDGAAAAVIGGQAVLAQNYLSFSRDAEREADRVGFNTLVRAGFDPDGMRKFFEKLDFNSRAYEGPTAAPAYLRTHPLTIDRISEAQNRLRQAKPVVHKDSLDFFLIQARMRVLQSNRFQSWKDAADYFKEDLKTAKGYKAIADHYGLAVAALKMKNPQLALQEIDLARQSGAKSPILEKFQSELYFSLGGAQREKGLQLAKQAYQNHPLSKMIVLNYATLLQKSKQPQKVLDLMRSQQAFARQSLVYQELIGQAYESLGKVSLSHQAIGEMYALMGNKVAAIQQLSIAQKANDADYYTMSEIDARLRQLRRDVAEEKKFD